MAERGKRSSLLHTVTLVKDVEVKDPRAYPIETFWSKFGHKVF
jgi:hypothetical protein